MIDHVDDLNVHPPSTRVANIAHFLTRNARRLRTLPAIIRQTKSVSWSELDARVSALCVAMRDDYGLRKGDRILVHGQNSKQFIEIMLACFRLGAIWVPSNFRLSPHEVSLQAQKARVSLMFCDAGFPEHARACLAGTVPAGAIIAIGEAEFGHDHEALLQKHAGAVFENATIGRDDPCWMFFTSGSTGRPKAVILTHGQLTFTIVNHLCDLMPDTTPDDRSLVIAPLSHGAGMHFLTQLAAGAASVLMPSGPFSPDVAWHVVETHKITNMFTVPTIVKRLVEHPSVDAFDHSGLRYVIYAGAPMYRADQKNALAKLGRVLVQYYGLGEVTGAITVLSRNEHSLEDHGSIRIGTCGIERTGMEISIQNDAGEPLRLGETGEICVAGPAVFAGYFEDDAANSAAFRNGWFRTGDLGHLDSAGYLFITGRASDMYISGGSNVYPREIEEVLLAHPALAEVAVLGVPDAEWGEVGWAICVLNSGHQTDEAELTAFIQGRIARYKWPRRYVFVSEIPKSGYGKVTRPLLRELLASEGLIAS